MPVDHETRYPTDWPQPGPIDLDVHDLPHASSDIEWWYIHAHVTLEDGRPISLFSSFFRQRDVSEARKVDRYAHTVLWGISDVDGKRYLPNVLADIEAPAITLERLNASADERDPHIRESLAELLEEGKLPHPDVRARAEASVPTDRLDLAYDDNRYIKLDDGRYRMVLVSDDGQSGCDVIITPRKGPIRHGDSGVVRGVTGGDMFYYFFPRCEIEGTVRLDGEDHPIASGSAWYDHEFGIAGEKGRTVAWNWMGIQLDDGRELTAYELIYTDDLSSAGGWCVVIDEQGEQHVYEDFSFTHSDPWTSPTTLIDYPRQWHLEVPGAGLSLYGRTVMDHQELITMISEPSFYEGRIHLEGTEHGKAISGNGYLERSGFEHNRTISEHLSRVGETTRKTVAELVPRRPTHRELVRMVSGADDRGLLDGIDTVKVGELALDPVRDIIDRGGKAWRSYSVLLCRELWASDPREPKGLHNWLALPELLHAGSLIIDDIQDGSRVRRGARAVHLDYGVPLGINAGNLAYFLGETVAQESEAPAEAKLKIYACYFEATRAGHIGQALDLAGPGHLLERAVEDGDPAALLEHLEIVYKLKTAVPSQSAARIGGILGEAPEEWIEGLEKYFLELGIAFQMVDDALDMEGFEDNRKVRGGDLLEGKWTWPAALALTRLDLADRRKLAAGIADPSPEIVEELLAMIGGTGAIADTKAEAHGRSHAAWAKVRPQLRDSHAVVRLRALSRYLLERRR